MVRREAKFHWGPVLGRFGVLKVNGVEGEDVYETSLDARLFAGVVCDYGFFEYWFASRIDTPCVARPCIFQVFRDMCGLGSVTGFLLVQKQECGSCIMMCMSSARTSIEDSARVHDSL